MAVKKTSAVIKTLLAAAIGDLAPGARPVFRELNLSLPIDGAEWESLERMLPSHPGVLPVIVDVHHTADGDYLFLGPATALSWLDRMRTEGGDRKHSVVARVHSGLNFEEESRIASGIAALHFAYDQSAARPNPALPGAHRTDLKLAAIVGLLAQFSEWQPSTAAIATRFFVSATTVRKAVQRLYEMSLRNPTWHGLGYLGNLLFVQTDVGKKQLLQSAQPKSKREEERVRGTSDARSPTTTHGPAVEAPQSAATSEPPSLPPGTLEPHQEPPKGATRSSVDVPTPLEEEDNASDGAEQESHVAPSRMAAQDGAGNGDPAACDGKAQLPTGHAASPADGREEDLTRVGEAMHPTFAEEPLSPAQPESQRREQHTLDGSTQSVPQVDAPLDSAWADTPLLSPLAASAPMPTHASSPLAALQPARRCEDAAASPDAAAPADVAPLTMAHVTAGRGTRDDGDTVRTTDAALAGERDRGHGSSLPRLDPSGEAASSAARNDRSETMTTCEEQGVIGSGEALPSEGAVHRVERDGPDCVASVGLSHAAPADSHPGHLDPAPARPDPMEAGADGERCVGAVAVAAAPPGEPEPEPQPTCADKDALAPAPIREHAATSPDGGAYPPSVPARTVESASGDVTTPIESTAPDDPAPSVVAMAEVPCAS